MESELFRLQKELKRMRSELERLKSPPLIIGNIKGRPCRRACHRQELHRSRFHCYNLRICPWPDEITVGARVALNKQTLAVMSVLPSSLDPIVIGAEIIEKPSISY